MENQNAPLIDGKEYHCYRKGKYIGVATYYEDDENIGESFQSQVITPAGEITNEVFIPDHWEFA